MGYFMIYLYLLDGKIINLSFYLKKRVFVTFYMMQLVAISNTSRILTVAGSPNLYSLCTTTDRDRRKGTEEAEGGPIIS